MVSTAQVLKLVNGHVKHILRVAEVALLPSQFEAYRTLVLNEFGRNGLERELEWLEGQVRSEERQGEGRNTPCTKGGGP